MEPSQDNQNYPGQPATPELPADSLVASVPGSSTDRQKPAPAHDVASHRANDRFEIFEKVAMERLHAGTDATRAARFLPLPVRLTVIAAAGISVLGVIWSVVARIPVQVNGMAAFVPLGGLESLNAPTSGILHFQISGLGPDTLPIKQRQSNQLLRDFWLNQARVFTSRVNSSFTLESLVEAALVPATGESLMLEGVNYSRERGSARQPLILSYSGGTILARITNQSANQELNSALLGTVPTDRLQRQQRLERLARAKQLGEISQQQSDQRTTLLKELSDRRELYARYVGLWKQGYLPGTTVLEEQSRINTLEGQLLSADSTQVNTRISQNDQLEEAKQAEVSNIDSLNKLQTQLISFLDATTVFAPVNGFYILSHNFFNGNIVRKDDELITFTRTPPSLPSVIPVFLDNSAAQQVSEGMKVLVTPTGISRAQFGGIPGIVIELNKLPVENDGLLGAVGSRGLTSKIQQVIPSPYLIRVRLEQESPDQCRGSSSFNCYRWSSRRLPPHPVRLATLADVQITTISRRPIDFVMPILRRKLGLVVDNK